MRVKSKSGLWAFTASLPIAALVLSGCASEASVSEQTAVPTELSTSPVTLVVQFEVPEDSGGFKKWRAVGDAFTALYPNVTVELVGISSEVKTGSNLQILTSNQAPDLALVPTNTNPYTQMVAAGELVPLNDIFEEGNLAERIGPPSAALLQADGNYYAVADNVAYYNVLWTNPKALSASGVNIPANRVFESPASLIEAGQKCRAAGYAGLAIGGASTYLASWMFDAALPTAVPAADFQNYLNHHKPNVDVTADFNAAGVVDALEVLGSYATQGLYQDGFLGQDPATAEALFVSGASCMVLSGSWLPGGLFKEGLESGEMTFEPSFAVLPPVNNAGEPSRLTPYYGSAYGIPKRSKNIEWAKKLLSFFMSDEGQLIGNVQAAGDLPAVLTVDVMEVDAFPELVRQLVSYVGENGSNSGWTSEVPGAYGQQFINPLLQQLQEGKLTAAEVAAAQQVELERIRAEG